jgi:hypothetical protein
LALLAGLSQKRQQLPSIVPLGIIPSGTGDIGTNIVQASTNVCWRDNAFSRRMLVRLH